MDANDLKLKERVKELRCLYELSRMALEEERDLASILSKTTKILPPAMQYPSFAEAKITLDKNIYATPKFKTCTNIIASTMVLSENRKGKVEVGYRKDIKSKHTKSLFLPEERKLVKTVSQELSLLVNRMTAEDEKLKLQQQLQQLERLAFVGELSAGIAHELNEPLGRILGFAQLIKNGGGLNQQQGEDIERIVKASLYTREIIKKLMLFSRQMPQQITRVNLNEIVSNILYFIDVRFQNGKVKQISKLDHDLPPFEADAVQISQVLVNLITNAIHAMPNGGILSIMTKLKENAVSLTVKDTGHGMTNDVKKKIFDPFFTTKPLGQGTGLGLSVVQGIVSSHHGKIVVSSAPGKGSRFEVTFPLSQNKLKNVKPQF